MKHVTSLTTVIAGPDAGLAAAAPCTFAGAFASASAAEIS